MLEWSHRRRGDTHPDTLQQITYNKIKEGDTVENTFTMETMKAMQEFADMDFQQELELLNDMFNLGIYVDTYKELGIEEN